MADLETTNCRQKRVKPPLAPFRIGSASESRVSPAWRFARAFRRRHAERVVRGPVAMVRDSHGEPRRRLILWLGWCLMLPAVWGCRQATEPSADVVVQLDLQPTPPVVGTAETTVKLSTASGDTVSAAEVRLEGNMNHAGMKPSFAQLTETAPGVYQGQLEFTMGGDWFVLVRVVLPDGRKMEQKIDVRGVRAT